MRALVAESNAVTRAGLRRILERAGFAVEELRDELAAACLLHQPGAPELALLAVDTMLADFGQVCAVMREAKPDVYIVALVPEVRRIHVSTVLDAGADDFLIKPASLQETEARVRVIGRRLAERRSGETPRGAPTAGDDTDSPTTDATHATGATKKRKRVELEKVIVERPEILRTLKTLLDDVTSTRTLASVFEQMGLAPVEEVSPSDAGERGVFSVWSPLLISIQESGQWLNTRIDLDKDNAARLFRAVERYEEFSEDRLFRVLHDIMDLVQDGIRTYAAGEGGANLYIPLAPIAGRSSDIPAPYDLAGETAERRHIGLLLRNDLRLLMTVTTESIRKEKPPIANVRRMDMLARDVHSAEYQIMLLRAGTILSDDYIRKIQAFIHSKNLSEKLEVFRPPAGTAEFLNEMDVNVRRSE